MNECAQTFVCLAMKKVIDNTFRQTFLCGEVTVVIFLKRWIDLWFPQWFFNRQSLMFNYGVSFARRDFIFNSKLYF